jgi:2-keto-4-pentenoate hydratase/2-oxohepta-3-ene-1,7-dioic acid hydratase in catechol pathway
MKLASYQSDGRECCGLVVDGRLLDLGAASGGVLKPPLAGLLADEQAMHLARELGLRAGGDEQFAERYCRPLRQVQFLAPIPRPGKVLCLGLNYRDHAAESGLPIPSEPVIFSKASSSVIGHGCPICLPQVSNQVDYEVELAVVIGRPARNVPASQAVHHVAGYTVLNDVTARDYQRDKPGGQWTLAKSFDTFCPMGPWLVTPEEVRTPGNLDIRCVVSTQVMQSSNTSQMIFSVSRIIEYLSQVLTLETGDVIGTGTPAGVGFARKPPRYLRPGDVVECTVQSIGTLVNSLKQGTA